MCPWEGQPGTGAEMHGMPSCPLRAGPAQPRGAHVVCLCPEPRVLPPACMWGQLPWKVCSPSKGTSPCLHVASKSLFQKTRSWAQSRPHAPVFTAAQGPGSGLRQEGRPRACQAGALGRGPQRRSQRGGHTCTKRQPRRPRERSCGCQGRGGRGGEAGLDAEATSLFRVNVLRAPALHVRVLTVSALRCVCFTTLKKSF